MRPVKIFLKNKWLPMFISLDNGFFALAFYHDYSAYLAEEYATTWEFFFNDFPEFIDMPDMTINFPINRIPAFIYCT